MEDEKDSIIVEFITKFQRLAYQKRVCFLCGGGRIWDIKNLGFWRPRHTPDCLFSRAEKLVIREQLPTGSYHTEPVIKLRFETCKEEESNE